MLGGGGYVAGPMVFAASTMRIPTALTEADAHFGLANRLAAPFAQRIFLAYPLETRYRSKVRGRRAADPGALAAAAAGRGAGDLRPAARTGRVLGVFGALAGARSLNEFVVDTWAASGPPILHLTGRRDYDLVRRRVAAARTIACCPRPTGSARRSPRRPRARALRLDRLGDRCGRAGLPSSCPYPFATGDHQAPNAQHFVRPAARLVRELDLDDVPELVRSLLDDPPRLERMGKAMLAAARPDAAEEIADELVAMAR